LPTTQSNPAAGRRNTLGKTVSQSTAFSETSLSEIRLLPQITFLERSERVLSLVADRIHRESWVISTA